MDGCYVAKFMLMCGNGFGCGVVWCGVVWCGVVWCGVVVVFAAALNFATFARVNFYFIFCYTFCFLRRWEYVNCGVVLRCKGR